MVESGDWITPHFNYVPRFEKPILYYWLAAGAYLVAGVGEASARFPSALAGLGLTLLTFAGARRWFDGSTGVLAGVVTATSFGYVMMSRQALPDLPLAFLITLTTWAALVAWLDDPAEVGGQVRRTGERRWWLVVAAAAGAGAFLTKGPVGIAIPALIVLPLLGGEVWSGRSTWRVRGSDVAIALLVFLVLATPWFLSMTLVHRVFNRNLGFYTERQFVELSALDAARDFLSSPTRVLCVLLAKDVDRLEAEGVSLVRLGETTYLNTGTLNFRAILDPDPVARIRHVVLVATVSSCLLRHVAPHWSRGGVRARPVVGEPNGNPRRDPENAHTRGRPLGADRQESDPLLRVRSRMPYSRRRARRLQGPVQPRWSASGSLGLRRWRSV